MEISSSKQTANESTGRSEHVGRTYSPLTSVPIDIVEEASKESFPASDAPSWTIVTGAGWASPMEDKSKQQRADTNRSFSPGDTNMETTAPRDRRLRQTVVMSRSRGSAADINVGDMERWFSAVGGGALAVYGLTRGTLGGLGLAAIGGALVYRGITGHCRLYDMLGVSSTGEQHSRQASVRAGHGIRIEKSITINRRPEELYRFWRKLENLPRFMRHLKSVHRLDHLRSHWVARGPLRMGATWDAEIITENEPEVVGWRSLPGSIVDTAGSVHFDYAPDGRGTEVRVVMKYDPPGGQLGESLARFFGDDPEKEIEEDLRHFREIMELGPR